MFVHIGENRVVSVEEIIGIFDFSAYATCQGVADFLDRKRDEGLLVRFSEKRTKSYVVCREGEVLLSPISSKTLEERYGSLLRGIDGLKADSGTADTAPSAGKEKVQG